MAPGWRWSDQYTSAARTSVSAPRKPPGARGLANPIPGVSFPEQPWWPGRAGQDQRPWNILLRPGPRPVFFLASAAHLPYISPKNPAERLDMRISPNPRAAPGLTGGQHV